MPREIIDSTKGTESAGGNPSPNAHRKLIRVISLTIFFGSALGLFFVLPQVKEYAGATPEQLYWKLGEEVIKGLLAASAVALLYDWLLKRETQAEMVQIFREEFKCLDKFRSDLATIVEELKSESVNARRSLDTLCQDLLKIKFLSNGDDPEGQTAYLKELILAPLRQGFLEDNQGGFYQVYVHSRFRRLYFGDRICFILNVVGNTPNFNFRPNDVIFHWTVDQWPSATLQEKWLDVKTLRVGGETWTQTRKYIQDRAIVAEFEKPANSISHFSHIVTYEYDVKVIDNLTSPRRLTLHIEYKLVRPTLRVDARRLGDRSVYSGIEPPEVNALSGKYVNASVGNGTCEVFMEDSVEPGTSVYFTITEQKQQPPALTG